MRFFKRLGLLLGLLHLVLYFAVPVYASYLDGIATPFICLPAMFAFGYFWPLLLFFAFAPTRFYREPDTQQFIRKIGDAFHIPVSGMALRVVSLILLWPFSIMNFHVLYHGLQE